MMKISTNPTTEAQRGKEFDVASLPIAARFVSRGILGGADTYGTLLEVTPGRVRVAIYKAPKHVVIGNREFDTAATTDTNWPHNVPVEYLGQDPNYALEGEEEEDTMARTKKINNSDASTTTTTATEAPVTATAVSPTEYLARTTVHNAPRATAAEAAKDAGSPSVQTSFITTAAEAVAANEGNPKAKVVISRWLFATGKLEHLLKSNAAADLLAPVRTNVENAYNEAKEHGVILPMVSSDLIKDDVFTGMQLGVRPEGSAKPKKAAKATTTEPTEVAEAPVTATTNSDSQEAEMAKTKTAKSTGKRAVKKATAAKKSAQPREKKVKEMRPCGCGCGESVTGNFKQGHDARYKGRLLRIERGEEQPKDLPAAMLKTGGRDGQPLEFKKSGEGMKCTNSRLNH